MKHSLLLLFIFVAAVFLGSAGLVLAEGGSGEVCATDGDCIYPLVCVVSGSSITGLCGGDTSSGSSSGSGSGISLPNPLCLGGPGTTPCIQNFPQLITKVTAYIFDIIGALAVLMIVVAGIMLVTSGGNLGQVEKGKKTLLYAIIGAAIALAGTGLIALVKAIIGAPPS